MKIIQSKWKQFRIVRYGGNLSKVAVAISRTMNIKLKILVIESSKTLTAVVVNTRSQQLQVKSYKAWTSPSYKVCRVTRLVVNKVVVVVETRNSFSKKVS